MDLLLNIDVSNPDFEFEIVAPLSTVPYFGYVGAAQGDVAGQNPPK
jgi:hypothetical protein